MFTRIHYKAIAEIIKENTDIQTEVRPLYRQGTYDARNRIARAMADFFYPDNPRFDRNKFMEACGAD